MADRGPYFAALDYGTGGGKCVLFDSEGRCQAVAREPWSFQSVSFEHEELVAGSAFDPHVFWKTLARCARRALDEANIAADAIAGIGTTALRLGTVFLDARGREIYAAPNMDGRGLAGGFQIMEKLSPAQGTRITGHWPPVVFSLARLLALRTRVPEARVAYVLSLNDWMAYRLCGALACEPSNSGESMLLDIGSRRWSREILELFDVDERILPPIVEPGTRLGRLSDRASEETGFAAGTPVFVGGADTQCAMLGAGAVEPGQAAAVLGTTTPVMSVEAQPCFDETARLWSGCHVLPDRWTVESNAGETGTAFEWLLGILGLEGEDVYARAEELVAQTPAGAAPVMSFAGPQIFDLAGFDPNRSAAFLFAANPRVARPTPGSFLRGFLSGVACATRANLEQIEALRGAPVDSLTLTGGMTRMPSLLREFARTSVRPLRVSEEPHATALGVAILSSVGAGVHPDVGSAARAMVRDSVLEDTDELSDEGDAEYARWRKRYPALAALPT